MRIGIGIPFVDEDGHPHDISSLGERARWIEDAGFSGIWMGDASFRDLATWPDPFLWMLGAAAATKRVELGFAALQLPLRNPVDNAQRLLTLQALSNDRLTAGVAPGSTRMAFEMVGVPFEGRFGKLHRDMGIIRRLCNGERVGDADLNPWEKFRPGPRFLLAAWGGGKMLERAASEYDGWLCSAARTNVATIVDGLARFRDLGGLRAVVASTRCDFSGERRAIGKGDPFNLVCSPSEAADRLSWLAGLGFDDIVINIDDGRRRGPFTSDLARERLLQLRELYVPASACTGMLTR